ncbi:hypothetical protein ACFOWX_09630 [Sphingorhabdus arenilitoris]|uniref:Lipoprotein n=1 Tax=Sphingorhabdus arenilitoris TaxID=1490041 RepID=A0ABV8RH34_9SPHN
MKRLRPDAAAACLRIAANDNSNNAWRAAPLCKCGWGDGGVRMVVGLCAAVLGLSACGEREASPEIPEAIERMMSASFPADGQIYVQSQERFLINSFTNLCLHQSSGELKGQYYSTPFNDYFRQVMNKERSIDSKGRFSDSNLDCKKERSVFLFSKSWPNRQGKPYKLVLAVWQGPIDAQGQPEAYWVGGVERGEGNMPPVMITSPFDIPGTGPTDEQSKKLSQMRLKEQKGFDGSRLSEKFAWSVQGDEE